MAGVAVVEVALDVRVTVKLEAEHATEEDLRRLVERDPESVRGAILGRISPGAATARSSAPATSLYAHEKEAGWLDEDRCAFVTEIIDADVAHTLNGRTLRVEHSAPEVVA